MRTALLKTAGCVALAALASCKPGMESTRPAVPDTKETLFQRGHRLYLGRQLDSAASVLRDAYLMDSTYVDPVKDLAAIYYDLGMRGKDGPDTRGLLRTSRTYFARWESLGARESEVYERLCELSVSLGDDRAFVKYAARHAALYPYDRQYYNLGLAYFGVADYGNVIKTQKEAVAKFKDSPYVGGFYRQLGRAYMKIDRDQTAERTLVAGVQAVDARLEGLRSDRPDFKSAPEYSRLVDDKIGMLLLLKGLHQTYQQPDKLEQVERQLREAGYAK